VPVAVLLLGYAESLKLFVVVWVSIWPVLLNTSMAIGQLDELLIDVSRTFHFNAVTTLRKIVAPAVVPAGWRPFEGHTATGALLLFSGLMSGASSARQSTIVEGDPTERIAVIPVDGLIANEASQQFARFMKTAEADKNVKGIVIEIDSPGGTVTASDEIHHRIMEFKKARPGVPIVASMGSLAASGGYYIACATDYVFAQPSTMTAASRPRFQ